MIPQSIISRWDLSDRITDGSVNYVSHVFCVAPFPYLLTHSEKADFLLEGARVVHGAFRECWSPQELECIVDTADNVII